MTNAAPKRPKTAEEFEDAFMSLVSSEMVRHRKNGERMAALLELLASTTGKTIAVMAEGDARVAEKLMIGVDGHIVETTTSFTPIFSALNAVFDEFRSRRDQK
ncbi:hypothetical protein GOZ78_03660 [Agrobacterium vitis]|uniref:hypothetical protein n=1 Tax=Agrobacterium vitis TaxID=373 RepID=UPI0008DC1224|nr:hypothetical protein [Agrobacterium vitis]MUO96641.1 hypothetical protein [Agrobacterium vitis]MUZ80748.1 hypothetical protein [Agrobacterium vitis]MVA09116.1 hypothetical protein [Agrobacterium vitis]MVA93172.1 hypothetical protein [Agrobacterium vitis]MVB03981.1 hypothetical protein [Agrobacterium vitis]